ncbi:MAG: SIMPL domain-containing protein [Actinomycetota bacterium]|nr:SIMPL domain-containing protein [Actinomycetota bacterium]
MLRIIKIKPTNLVLFAFLLLLLLTIASCIGSNSSPVSKSGSRQNVIEVTGEGKSYVPADEVSISFTIRTIRNTSSRAMIDNNTVANKILTAIKNSGLSASEIKTGSISLTPQYQYKEGRAPKISNYVAENRVIIKTKKLNKIASIIDAATTSGANEVSELRFQLSEDNKFKQNNLKLAVSDARKKASILAKSLNQNVGRALVISEKTIPAPYPPYPIEYGGYRSIAIKSAVADLPPIVPPSDIEITTQVSVIFELR